MKKRVKYRIFSSSSNTPVVTRTYLQQDIIKKAPQLRLGADTV